MLLKIQKKGLKNLELPEVTIELLRGYLKLIVREIGCLTILREINNQKSQTYKVQLFLNTSLTNIPIIIIQKFFGDTYLLNNKCFSTINHNHLIRNKFTIFTC